MQEYKIPVNRPQMLFANRGKFIIYTLNHKKRDILFLITLANLTRFL